MSAGELIGIIILGGFGAHFVAALKGKFPPLSRLAAIGSGSVLAFFLWASWKGDWWDAWYFIIMAGAVIYTLVFEMDLHFGEREAVLRFGDRDWVLRAGNIYTLEQMGDGYRLERIPAVKRPNA